ncbi:growth arrest and DNA damage-inducible proteins-interacting protein 1 [Sphaerodactylus townsendi]|uniref:growth arrest and DNA damage-inducible proteins-interacting protein 1 n=1 Tax=Sphaerodactylus townsendi TaxID=933632 RepID=UPI0020274148|nr:growth arrest and DNA damage-inducible proteins-interacting protein 1 [Sphaerodactylus townsendi]
MAAALAALGGRWLPVGLRGVRAYNARPLRLRLGGVYLPDPANPRTPAWQLEAAYEAKLYGRHGAASGVDPARLWLSPEQLAEEEAEERELCPSLREMEAALDARERQEEAQRRSREELIASRMAKMPQMIADWRREKQERRAKELEEKARRERLLAEARERLGYNVDHRSPQFQEMVQEMEKTRRKELKLQKKQRREQVLAKKAAEAAAAASQPSKEEEVQTISSTQQTT